MLLNNDGGGIFHFLPVATQTDAFEEHVATPHGVDFAQVAALYGLVYERPISPADLRAAVRDLDRPTARQRLIEVENRPRARTSPCTADIAERGQPARTGSIAPSLISVSASSAAGSESRTIPPPA